MSINIKKNIKWFKDNLVTGGEIEWKLEMNKIKQKCYITI